MIPLDPTQIGLQVSDPKLLYIPWEHLPSRELFDKPKSSLITKYPFLP